MDISQTALPTASSSDGAAWEGIVREREGSVLLPWATYLQSCVCPQPNSGNEGTPKASTFCDVTTLSTHCHFPLNQGANACAERKRNQPPAFRAHTQ